MHGAGVETRCQPISEWCDDETVSTTEELVLVDEVDVGDADDALIEILLEVEARLLQPLEVHHRADVEFHLRTHTPNMTSFCSNV